MLVIRFFRTGKKNQPSFKIVVTDKRKSSTKGPYVEEVGFWNPVTKEKVLRQERIKYWISVGAKPSPTVFNLLISEKIIEGKKISVHKKAKEKKEPVPTEAPVPTQAPIGEGKLKEEAPKEEVPKEEKPKKEKEPKEEPPKEAKIEEKPAEAKPKEETPKTE